MRKNLIWIGFCIIVCSKSFTFYRTTWERSAYIKKIVYCYETMIDHERNFVEHLQFTYEASDF